MANAVANNCRKIGGKRKNGGILPANKASDKAERREKAAQTKGMKSETNGGVNAANWVVCSVVFPLAHHRQHYRPLGATTPGPAPTVALNLTMALSPSRFQGPTIPPPFCSTAWVVAQVICKWPADEAEGLGNIGTTSTNIRNRNSTTHSHRTTIRATTIRWGTQTLEHFMCQPTRLPTRQWDIAMKTAQSKVIYLLLYKR